MAVDKMATVDEIKARLDELEKRVTRLETAWNTLKAEVDDLTEILFSQRKLIEQMDKVVISVRELAEAIKKKKGIWWG